MHPELNLIHIGLRLGLSVLLGGLIGIERELHGKSAGLRTHMLVSVGSALFTVLSYALPVILGAEMRSDPTRIAAQIVTGVGFLGAGTILQAKGSVHGLTTAASIWFVAAIGMAVGGGFYLGACLATVLGHVVLVAFYHVEQSMLRRKGGRHSVQVRLTERLDSRWVESLVRGLGNRPLRWVTAQEPDGASLHIEGRIVQKDLDRLLEALQARGTIRELRVDKS